MNPTIPFVNNSSTSSGNGAEQLVNSGTLYCTVNAVQERATGGQACQVSFCAEPTEAARVRTLYFTVNAYEERSSGGQACQVPV